MPANPLTALDREKIHAGIVRGDSCAVIAGSIGRSRSAISAEITRNGGRANYSPTAAEARAVQCRARPKTRLLTDATLRWHVTKRLMAGDSPMTISIELARGTHDGYSAKISHETIYQGIYAPQRVALPAKAYKLLHHRQPRRPRQGQRHVQQRSSPLGVFNTIATRPATATERNEVGHLEGDQIIGTRNRSAIITIFDRATRYLWLARHDHPTNGYNADTTATALTALITTIPPALRHTLTWDRGSEMARHHHIAKATGIDIYFCDPHKPWQRPTNENGNGLIRRWLPKSTDLSIYTQDDLNRIAHRINTIPRRSLNWHTAADRYHHAVAMTG